MMENGLLMIVLMIVFGCGGGDGHCNKPEAACEAEEDKEARAEGE